jgi:hypothetical protein
MPTITIDHRSDEEIAEARRRALEAQRGRAMERVTRGFEMTSVSSAQMKRSFERMGRWLNSLPQDSASD